MPSTGKQDAGKHIVSAFDEALMAIQAKIAEMGGLAEDMLADSLTGVRRRDVPLCEEVVLRDKRMDRLEAEVEEMTIRLIALRAPVALDLRVLVACLKASATLERIGDLSKNIAKRGI